MRQQLTEMFSLPVCSDAGISFQSLLGNILKGTALHFPEHQISIWIKIAYTLFVIALVPVYWKHWGPANFLWFSDVALFFTVGALWMESKLLASMIAVGVLIPELYWNFELITRILTGKKLAGLTDYMWNKKYPLYLRLLSLFHLILPVIIIMMLMQFGYSTSAIYYQTVLAWLILFLCYKLTPPSANINRTFGPGNSPQFKVPPPIYLLLIMAAYPLLLFLPSHLILKALFG